MKKFIFLFLLFVSCIGFSQSIYNSQQIGQTGRNQNVSRGFWVKSDSFLCNAAVWIPANGGAGKVFTSDADGFGTWQNISAWGLQGNTGTNPATDFLGTTDVKDLILKTNNIERSRFGATGQWITQTSFSSNDTFLVAITNNALGGGFKALRLQHHTNDGESGVACIDAVGFGKTRNYSVFGFTDYAAKNAIVESYYDSLTQTSGLHLGVQNDNNIRYTVRMATDSGIVFRTPLVYVDGLQGVGKALMSDANGGASWQPITGTTVLDSISETGDTISLSVNTTHVITSESVILDATLIFPTGITGNWIDIVFSKSIVTLTNSGVNADLISLLEPTFGTSKRYVNIGGNWY